MAFRLSLQRIFIGLENTVWFQIFYCLSILLYYVSLCFICRQVRWNVVAYWPLDDIYAALTECKHQQRLLVRWKLMITTVIMHGNALMHEVITWTYWWPMQNSFLLTWQKVLRELESVCYRKIVMQSGDPWEFCHEIWHQSLSFELGRGYIATLNASL